MKKISFEFAQQLIDRAKRARVRRRIVAMLCVVVLLFTVNRTTFPADAMEGEPTCGIPAHAHDEECFDAEGNLICGLEAHAHSDDCFQYEEDAVEETGAEPVEGGVDEQELSFGDDDATQETDAVTEDADAEQGYRFTLGDSSPVMLSEILAAVGLEGLEVDEAGQVVDDIHPEGMIHIEETPTGRAVVVDRDFDDVELAVIAGDDVYTISLLDAVVAPAEEAQEPTEVEIEAQEEPEEEPIEEEPIEEEPIEEEPAEEEAIEDERVEEEPVEEESVEEEPAEEELAEEELTEEEETVEEESADEEPAEEKSAEEKPSEEEAAEEEQVEEESAEEESTEEESTEEEPADEEETVEEETGEEEQVEEESTKEEVAEDESAEAAQLRFEASIDVSDMEAPFALRQLMAMAEPDDEPEAEPDETEPEAAEVEADDEASVEDTEDMQADDTDAWLIDYDEQLLAVERAEDDWLVTPAAAFDSAVITVTTPAAEYALTLENATVEAEPEVDAEALTYAASYDLSLVELPLSLPRMMADARAEDMREDEVWEAEYDENLIDIDETGLVTPVAEFDETLIAVTAGADRFEFTLLNYAEVPTQSALDLGLAVVTPVDESLAFDMEATGTADLLSEAQANVALAAVESVRAAETPEAEAEEENEAEAEALPEEGIVTLESRTEYQAFNISLINVDAAEYEDGFNVTVTLPEGMTVSDAQLYHVLEEEPGITTVEQLEVDSGESEADTLNTFSFTADSLEAADTYVLSYTVDFYYGEFEYHLDGEGSMLLSELFDVLKIDEDAAEAEKVTFTDSELVQVAHLQKDWLLTSLAPFDTEEKLTVAMSNGNLYEIAVFDAQGLGYIEELKFSSVKTGTEPFDTTAGRGNDTGANDDIIRSFDSIVYTLDVQAQSHSASTTEYAKLIYTFSVPYDEEVTLNLDSMGTVEKISEEQVDGMRVYTLKTTDTVKMPGHTYPEFVLKVGNKKEGYTIQPVITAQVEDNEIVKSVTMPLTKVTSRPAYNVQLDLVNRLSAVNPYTVDGEQVKGMLANYAFAVQMRNFEENKGLRGIELPDKNTPITFDIDLSSTYRKDGDTVEHNLEGLFPVKLYHVEENGASTTTDYQLPTSSSTSAYTHNGGYVYDNGKVTIEQEGLTLHVTIKDFDVDSNGFPKADASGYERFLNSDGTLKIGNISTYRFDLLQVTTHTVDGVERDIQSSFGTNSDNGTVQVNATAKNLRMKSENGDDVGPDKVFKETIDETMDKNDNVVVTNRQFYGGEALYDHEIFFSYPGAINDGSDHSTEGNKSDGSDSAVINANVWFTAYFDQIDMGADQYKLRTIAYDQLVKFDDTVFEPAFDTMSFPHDGSDYIWGVNRDWEQMEVLYVGRDSGWEHGSLKPWEDGYDAVMKAAKEEDANLSYYDSWSALKAAGKTCVGYLIKWRGCSVVTEHGKMGVPIQLPLHIKNDAALMGEDKRDENDNLIASYMITMSTNGWTIQDAENALGDEIATSSGNVYTDYSNFARDPDNQYLFSLDNHSVDVDRDDNYWKNKYDGTGYIGGGTAGFLHGDTMLIVPYTTTVVKHVAQRSDDDYKQVFNMNQHQRYVDFVITGGMQFGQRVDINNDNWTTTVTLEDVPPEHLTYVEGSAYVGGTYTEHTPDKGSVVGGTPITPVQDGNKLTFTLYNVPVKNSINIPEIEIHYSCFIGNLDYPESDVKNGDTMKNIVSIHTSEDKRKISAENGNISEAGISVVKQAEYNIEKYGTDSIELDGTGTYDLVVNNSTDIPRPNLYAIDIMPYKRDGHTQEGKYKLLSLKLLTETLGSNNLDDISFFYTDDRTKLNGKDKAEEIGLDSITTGWTPLRFDSATGEITGFSDWPVAIAYVDREFPRMRAAHFVMTYQGDCGRVGDDLYNYFTEGKLFTQATADVYSRELSGVAWFDYDKDGEIDNGNGAETRLAGVTVELYELDENGNRKNQGPVMTTTTDANGHYSFGVPESIPSEWDTEEKIREHILHAGDYDIVFSGEQVEKFRDVTTKYAAGVANEVNSKADGTKDNDMLKTAVIHRVHMKSIAEMKADSVSSASHRHVVEYQNAGLIVDADMVITKAWQGADGQTMDWPTNQPIVLTLVRELGAVDTEFGPVTVELKEGQEVEIDGFNVTIDVTRNDDGAYTVCFKGLPGRSKDDSGIYKWYATEEHIDGYGIRYPGNAVRVGNGETLVNYVASYTLPSTGGTGTLVYTVGGLLLVLGAAILLALKGRRDNY